MNDLKYLKAKDAMFSTLFNICIPIIKNNEYYLYDYCESYLEKIFTCLGFDDDLVKLTDFCEAYEENCRRIWKIRHPSKPYEWMYMDDIYYILKEKTINN